MPLRNASVPTHGVSDPQLLDVIQLEIFIVSTLIEGVSACICVWLSSSFGPNGTAIADCRGISKITIHKHAILVVQ